MLQLRNMKRIRLKRLKRDRSYKYDNTDNPIFKRNEKGGDVYEVDLLGNEIYPEMGEPFARNEFGDFYYAKDCNGNEIYPIRQQLSFLIQTPDGPKIAIEKSGKQKYPKDKKGNEYYLIEPESGEPFPLRDEKGDIYFCRHKKGFEMIPWNFKSCINDQYYTTHDSIGNEIYCRESDVRQCLEKVCPVLCACIVEVPLILGAILPLM